MVVRDIMNQSLKTAKPDTLIKDIASLMCLNEISGVPVVDDDGILTGILSEKDIFKAMFPQTADIVADGLKHNYETSESCYVDILDKSAGDLMTQTVASVSPDMPLLKAVTMMCARNIRRIPVTDKNNKLVGIISIGDVHKAIFQENLLKVS